MIQVEEEKGLGDGQKMETIMAQQVGLKIFRTYTNWGTLLDDSMRKVSKAVKEWYDKGCADTDLENIFIGWDDASAPSYTERPKTEKLKAEASSSSQ